MSVVVKGMELPKNCDSCLACHITDNQYAYCGILERVICKRNDIYFGRHEDCPLIDLPKAREIDRRR